MRLLLKTLLFTLLVPGTAAGWLPWLIGRGGPPASAPWRAAGAALLVAGASLYAWCARDFARRGRGTPAPIDAPKRLVATGPYRFVRNPMYLGVLAAMLGWACWYADARIALYAACFAALFHGVVVVYEEPALRRAFGREYEEYLAGTPRWLPRRPRT